MANLEQLLAHGFRHIGDWRTASCRVHRISWIKRKPGVYAFVVDGQVRYVGKADQLHKRLRNYSNRCVRAATSKALRACHVEIVRSIEAGLIVAVYALALDPSDDTTNWDLERRLIQQLSPPWNRTHGISN